MNREIELYGVKAQVPESEHFWLNEKLPVPTWCFSLFTAANADQHGLHTDKNVNAREIVAIAADHARCWWMEKASNTRKEWIEREPFDWDGCEKECDEIIHAANWAEIARRARGGE